jgi:hypothetical protein
MIVSTDEDSLPGVLLIFRRVPLRLINLSSALVAHMVGSRDSRIPLRRLLHVIPILSLLTFGLPSRFWLTKDHSELYDRSDGPRLPGILSTGYSFKRNVRSIS